MNERTAYGVCAQCRQSLRICCGDDHEAWCAEHCPNRADRRERRRLFPPLVGEMERRIWSGVYAAAFVQLMHEKWSRTDSPLFNAKVHDDHSRVAVMEADAAVYAYRRRVTDDNAW